MANSVNPNFFFYSFSVSEIAEWSTHELAMASDSEQRVVSAHGGYSKLFTHFCVFALISPPQRQLLYKLVSTQARPILTWITSQH